MQNCVNELAGKLIHGSAWFALQAARLNPNWGLTTISQMIQVNQVEDELRETSSVRFRPKLKGQPTEQGGMGLN